MKDRKVCRTCREYEPLGFEGSGISTPDGTREWVYGIGRCNQPKSVHGGWVAAKFGDMIAKQETPRKNLPEWCACVYHKHGERK